MPHVIVKLWPGKSEPQKRELGVAIVQDVTRVLNYGEDAVSVGFEEIGPEEWSARVYKPDIQDKWDTLVKEPGYGPGRKSSAVGG